jgi:uncharacterized protein YdhG (YjbR/CyaY superfamily)
VAKTNFKTVDQYILSRPEALQPTLHKVRSILRKALPKAEEVISYQIPAYKLPGGPALFFAGWTEHWSLYPATEGLVRTFRRELVPYEISKGTIRFPLSEPVPTKLIQAIARYRAQENAERAALKEKAAAAGKKPVKKKGATARASLRKARTP